MFRVIKILSTLIIIFFIYSKIQTKGVYANKLDLGYEYEQQRPVTAENQLVRPQATQNQPMNVTGWTIQNYRVDAGEPKILPQTEGFGYQNRDIYQESSMETEEEEDELGGLHHQTIYEVDNPYQNALN